MLSERHAGAGLRLVLIVALAACLAGCGPGARLTVVAPDGSERALEWKALERQFPPADGEPGLPVDRALWTAGHRVVERLEVVDTAGNRHGFDWATAADTAWWLKNGRLEIAGEEVRPSRVIVHAHPLLAEAQMCITDIAPTVARALGLPAPAQATGRAVEVPAAARVLLLFLDGFGYVRYTEARAGGLIPNLSALGEPLPGVTVFPPATSVATAALLTGALPEVSGVDQRGIRRTEVETLFDVASAAGLRVVAVEGESLPFNLRGAEVQLSGDRDGDGSTDDNVLNNSLAVLDDGMPDLFFVHFHGIDDAGHTYGPGAPEEEATIRVVDEAVGRLWQALPPGTLVVIFADHGMHTVQEEGRVGNHQALIARDMVIPIWILQK